MMARAGSHEEEEEGFPRGSQDEWLGARSAWFSWKRGWLWVLVVVVGEVDSLSAVLIFRRLRFRSRVLVPSVSMHGWSENGMGSTRLTRMASGCACSWCTGRCPRRRHTVSAETVRTTHTRDGCASDRKHQVSTFAFMSHQIIIISYLFLVASDTGGGCTQTRRAVAGIGIGLGLRRGLRGRHLSP